MCAACWAAGAGGGGCGAGSGRWHRRGLDGDGSGTLHCPGRRRGALTARPWVCTTWRCPFDRHTMHPCLGRARLCALLLVLSAGMLRDHQHLPHAEPVPLPLQNPAISNSSISTCTHRDAITQGVHKCPRRCFMSRMSGWRVWTRRPGATCCRTGRCAQPVVDLDPCFESPFPGLFHICALGLSEPSLCADTRLGHGGS